MPRYYCDYCDTYLTHDSPSVRKQHNSGYKHKANIRSYYQKFEEQQTQSLIDQKIKQHLGQTVVYQQIGAAYNQHLAAYPGALPRLPVMPSPMLPPGAVPHNFAPGIRPPIQQVPLPGPPGIPGYGSAPMAPMQAPPASSLSQQFIGPQAPSGAGAPSPASGGHPPPGSGSNMYNGNSIQITAAASSSAGAYAYPFSQPSQTSL